MGSITSFTFALTGQKPAYHGDNGRSEVVVTARSAEEAWMKLGCILGASEYAIRDAGWYQESERQLEIHGDGGRIVNVVNELASIPNESYRYTPVPMVLFECNDGRRLYLWSNGYNVERYRRSGEPAMIEANIQYAIDFQGRELLLSIWEI